MKYSLLSLLIIAATLLMAKPVQAIDIRSAGPAKGTPVKGNWSKDSCWEPMQVPGPGDNVAISDGDTIYVDTTTQVDNITIGDGTSGALIFKADKAVNLTVPGDVTINNGGIFRGTGSSTTTCYNDTLFLTGSFLNNNGYVDFRNGKTGMYEVVCLYLQGTGNSIIKTRAVYGATTNEFNMITVNKSGTGKVTLQSDIFMPGGSTDYPNQQPYLDLLHGKVYTGNYAIITQSTSGGPNGGDLIPHASKDSYIIGCLARGMSSSGTATRFFPVGDADAYRPMKVRNQSVGNATGHFLKVRAIRGNANPGGAALPAGIDKISTVRYYKLNYDRDTSLAYPQMSLDRFFPSYGEQDGVGAGNPNLRIAYTKPPDSLVNWKIMGQVVHHDTTEFTDPPAYWNADSLASGFYDTLVAGGPATYVAIARVTGTTENSLNFTTVGVQNHSQLPDAASLAQNFPNPFNPTTLIEYSVTHSGRVRLEVFNIAGQSVARLVDAEQPAGTHKVSFDGSRLASGVYFYRMISNASAFTRSMILVK